MPATEAPTIRIIGFKTTYDLTPRRGRPLDENVDEAGFLLDAKGKRFMDREAVDWITYAPAHSPLNTRNIERIKHMRPDLEKMGNDPEGRKYAFMQARWEQIEPAYLAWKEGREAPLDGTALAVWPGLSPEQIEVFRQFGVRTVEEVAKLSENQMEKIRLPNMRELKSQASIFLSNTGAANAAAREAALVEQMTAMGERIREMEAALAAKSAPEAKTSDEDEVASLRAQLDAAGIDYDGRWKAPKLRAHLPVAEAA